MSSVASFTCTRTTPRLRGAEDARGRTDDLGAIAYAWETPSHRDTEPFPWVAEYDAANVMRGVVHVYKNDTEAPRRRRMHEGALEDLGDCLCMGNTEPQETQSRFPGSRIRCGECHAWRRSRVQERHRGTEAPRMHEGALMISGQLLMHGKHRATGRFTGSRTMRKSSVARHVFRTTRGTVAPRCAGAR